MKDAVAVRWATALRSGEYKQGDNLLKQREHYNTGGELLHCCLGVLCELYVQDHPNSPLRSEPKPGPKTKNPLVCEPYVFGDRTEYPPEDIQKWAGITEHGCTRLAELNDSGSSFNTIADFIEESVEEL